MLNLDDFKRQINYCLLPNGTATDMVMQTKGRYGDQTDYAYMAGMGIWFENFALPAVINECLMQSYNGTIRLFPNWPKNKDARFENLRAAGAFLLSAVQVKGSINAIDILSEKGQTLRLISPWKKGAVITTTGGKKKVASGEIVIQTLPGERIRLSPLN